MTGISLEVFCEHFPRLYHMAEVDSWPSIQAHGLLSVSALLDLFGYEGPERERIESQHRPEGISINHSKYGQVLIRDQNPLPPHLLKRSLIDMEPTEWYQLLNGKSFFWATEKRLKDLLNASWYRDRPHCVLAVDTESFLERYEKKVTLCPVNSGCVRPNPIAHRRGSMTFLSMSDYPFDDWRKRRGSAKKAIAEVTVPYSVPDVMEVLVRADLIQGDTHLEQLY